MSAYWRDFDETKCTSFWIKDDKLVEQSKEIWERIKNWIKKEFDTEPVQPLPQSNLKKIALAPHDFAGNFYLNCFVNPKTIEINLYNAANFTLWLI